MEASTSKTLLLFFLNLTSAIVGKKYVLKMAKAWRYCVFTLFREIFWKL